MKMQRPSILNHPSAGYRTGDSVSIDLHSTVCITTAYQNNSNLWQAGHACLPFEMQAWYLENVLYVANEVVSCSGVLLSLKASQKNVLAFVKLIVSSMLTMSSKEGGCRPNCYKYTCTQ